MTKIGINGFGRIGRMVLRAFLESSKYNNIKIVCINDLTAKEINLHLLKYDSVHGKMNFDILETDDGMQINGHNIKMISESHPEKIDWKSRNVDVVFECTGRFAKRIDAQKHINSGAKLVVISAPAEGADKTIVFGINHRDIASTDVIISNSSCTTNCLAPIAYLLDKKFEIESGFMTTIHAYTGDQRLVDTAHSDLRRARAAALSMIPSSTGAAKAIGLVLPNLVGKLEGTSIRVPTPNVSMIDFVCVLKNKTDVEEINRIMKYAAKMEFAGILDYNDKALVSSDFNHSSYSSIFDATGTTVIGGKLCRVVAWYDNEFGFSNRMLDLCQYIANSSS